MESVRGGRERERVQKKNYAYRTHAGNISSPFLFPCHLVSMGGVCVCVTYLFALVRERAVNMVVLCKRYDMATTTATTTMVPRQKFNKFPPNSPFPFCIE